MEIVIIDSGMLGASLAFEAINLGVRVVPPACLSPRLNHGKPPRDYQQLNDAGIDAHQAPQTRFSHRRWLHLTGSAEFRHPHGAAALAVQARQLTVCG